MLITKLLFARHNVQAEEEVRDLQKKMQQLENDLDQTQEKLMAANQRLEEKEKALQNVSHSFQTTIFIFFSFFLSFLSYLPDTLTHPYLDIGWCCCVSRHVDVCVVPGQPRQRQLGQGRGWGSRKENATARKRAGPDPV